MDEHKAVAAVLAGLALVSLAACAAASAPVAGTPAGAYTSCSEEDASAPGQTFPCYWNGGVNGEGRTYVLTEPVCTLAQVAVSDAFHARGLVDPITSCDDLESQTGSF